MNKKTILSAIAALGLSLTAAAENERLVLTYADGMRATVQLSYLDHLAYDHIDTDRTTGLGYLSMLAHMNSGAINRITLDGLVGVDFLADFSNHFGTYREVQREHGENATIIMLNCINNRNGNTYVITPERDEDYTAQRYGERGYFIIDTPLGFDSDFVITGVETGRRYAATWMLQNDSENPNGQSCWAFTMPSEAVRITSWATEETIYEGYDWLGDYAGFPVEVNDGYVTGLSGYAFAPASLTLKGNATYLFATTAPASLSAHGSYTYDADAEKFRYVPKADDADLVAPTGEHEYAVTADRLHSPFNADEANLDALAIHVRDLTVDKPENTRHFLAFPKEQYDDACIDYNCAYFNNYNGTTGRSTQSLLEARAGDPNLEDFSYAWYFVDNYGASFREVVLNFEAYDDLPVAESIFDPGYGRFNLDGREMYFLHTADGQYSVGEYEAPVDPTPGLGEAAPWEGPLTYYAAANGRYDGGALSPNATVTVMLDQNYNGSSNPGHAVLKATCGGRELIGAGGDYTYYPAERKIVISHVLQGTDMTWNTDYLDVVLTVASDLQTLIIEGVDGYLYGSRTNTCIEVGDNCVLKAQ